MLAARTIGASDLRIMFRHILPNIIGPLIVVESLSIPGYNSLEAFLSFIGLGINPPTPSWGAMIADGAQAVRTYRNQAIFPALAVKMFAFDFLCDGRGMRLSLAYIVTNKKIHNQYLSAVEDLTAG